MSEDGYRPTCNFRWKVFIGSDKPVLQQQWVSIFEGEEPEWRGLVTYVATVQPELKQE